MSDTQRGGIMSLPPADDGDEVAAIIRAWGVLIGRHGVRHAAWMLTIAAQVAAKELAATQDHAGAALDAIAISSARNAPSWTARLAKPLPADPQKRAIAAIGIAAGIVGDIGDKDAGEIPGEDGVRIAVRHPVAETLDDLAQAIRDLGRGITDPMLRSARIGGAAMPVSRRRKQQMARVLYAAVTAPERGQKVLRSRDAHKRIAAALGVSAEAVKEWVSKRGGGRDRRK